jgi:hypothetical protein
MRTLHGRCAADQGGSRACKGQERESEEREDEDKSAHGRDLGAMFACDVNRKTTRPRVPRQVPLGSEG